MIRHVIHLPLPPSTNRIWSTARNRGGVQIFKSPRYVRWIKKSDGEFLAAGHNRGCKRIEGRFFCAVSVAEGTRGDIDNRIKPILDWAQHAGLISDDKNCRRLTIGYIEPSLALKGCVLSLTECE